MIDIMFKAVNKTSWDFFAESNNLVETCNIDEIGPIEEKNWHVNVRITNININPSMLAQGGPGVEWVNPTMVKTPTRVWAGGMNYWKPEIING
jgi:hypothetical protein